jgi:hypothetical protein
MTITALLLWLRSHKSFALIGIALSLLALQSVRLSLARHEIATKVAALKLEQMQLTQATATIEALRAQITTQNQAVDQWQAAAKAASDRASVAIAKAKTGSETALKLSNQILSSKPDPLDSDCVATRKLLEAMP